MITEDGQLFGEGKINSIKLLTQIRNRVTGYDDFENTQMRHMQIGSNLP